MLQIAEKKQIDEWLYKSFALPFKIGNSAKCYSDAAFILQACKKRYATNLSQFIINALPSLILIRILIDDQLDELMKQVQTELDELRQGNEILINALSQHHFGSVFWLQ